MTDTLPARFGAPLLVAHRAELQAMLLSALGDATVLPDWPCESAAVHSSERMVVRRGDGAALEADLIVAADGIRSAVRSHLFRGEAAAEYAGYTAWRGVASLPAHLVDELDTGEFLGRGRLFGVARLPGDRAYWWASARGPAPEGPNRDALLERFAGWAKPIAALVEATPSEDIHATLLQRRAPVERMTWQRLAFVGDAAHPMLPNIGQGGCQAIEDAVVLGGLLARAGRDLPPALARYESLRARHTRQVVKASDRMAKAVHLANPLAIALRNAAFTATPPGAVARRLSPIVGYDAVAVSVAA